MAAPELRRLSQAHRLAQSRIGAATVLQMIAIWPLLDTENLDGTFPRWMQGVTPIVATQRAASARLAANYYSVSRSLTIGAADFTPALAEAVPTKALTTSMLVTGVVSLRSNLAGGLVLARAIDIAQTRTAGAAMRHALNGGRETLLQSIKTDRRAAGYERVTSGNACEFCSMLADRGAVYGADSADFEAHDHCSCSAEPVFE